MAEQKVELTYFKKSGKYYTEGEYYADDDQTLNQVWDDVKEMRAGGRLPGLSLRDAEGGHDEFIVLVNAPGHAHNHPKLLL
jgi:hypothetical protein